MGKSRKGNVASSCPGCIELVDVGLDIGQATDETLVLPAGRDVGTEYTVPRLGQSGVLVTNEAPELRVGALEHGQTVDGRVDVDALALNDVGINDPGLLAVAVERVRVRLAIDDETGPAVRDHVDVRKVDVAVGLDEVGSEDGSEQLGRSHWVLLGEDVDGVLDGIGSHDDAVIGFGVAIYVFVSFGIIFRV